MDAEISDFDFEADLNSMDLLKSLHQNRCQELANYIYEDIFHESAVFGKASAMIVLSVSIIIGNLLVILAVLISRRLRTVTNFFIASLAVSDFVIGVGVLPFSFTQDLLGLWTFGHLWCRVWLALDVWVSTASIYNLVVIALDRYVAVTRPLSYRSLVTPKKAALAVCAAWIWSFLVSFPPMVSFQSGENPKEINSSSQLTDFIDCQCTALDNSIYYIFFSASSSFYFPFTVLLYIYVKIYIKIRRATAAVDRGYVTLKRKPTNPEAMNNMSNSDQPNRSAFARLSWKKRTNGKKTSFVVTTAKSSTTSLQSTNLEFIALRVHRGRYNAAGATTNGTENGQNQSKSMTTKSADPSPIPPRRIAALKITNPPSYHSQDYMDDDDMDVEEAAKGDKQMKEYVRRMSKLVSCDYKSIDRREPDLVAPAKTSTFPKSKSTQFKSERYLAFLEVRRESMGSTSAAFDHSGSNCTETPTGGGSPKNKVRQRLHEKYDKKLKREVRAAKTVALVTGCFFICWSGFCVVYTMKALPFCHLDTGPGGDESCVPPWVFTIVLWLGYTNSALNPLIYAVCNRQFRIAFKRILCCCFCGGADRRRSARDECRSLFRRHFRGRSNKRCHSEPFLAKNVGVTSSTKLIVTPPSQNQDQNGEQSSISDTAGM